MWTSESALENKLSLAFMLILLKNKNEKIDITKKKLLIFDIANSEISSTVELQRWPFDGVGGSRQTRRAPSWPPSGEVASAKRKSDSIAGVQLERRQTTRL